jgi:hypothetical protein
VIAQSTTTQNGVLALAASVPLAISASVMMPIVFCASLVPWASETIDAEQIWPIRNPALRLSARIERAIRYTR